MRMKIPITGTVKSVQPCVTGDDDDNIRLIPIDLGNVSWTMVELDLEDEVMIIEVTPSPTISEPTGEADAEGNPTHRTRDATPNEKQGFLEHAKGFSTERKTKDELYLLSKSPRLKNPFKGGADSWK